MRRLVGLIWLAAALAQAAAAAPPARLVVVERAPLTISGRGFPASRTVTLVVRTPVTSERRVVRTDARGGFRVVARRVSLTGRLRCAVGVAIFARVEGGGVVLWSQQLPDCPAPLRPPASDAS